MLQHTDIAGLLNHYLPAPPSGQKVQKDSSYWLASALMAVELFARKVRKGRPLGHRVTYFSSQFPLESFIENCGEHGIQFGGGLGLKYLHRIDLGLQRIKLRDYLTLHFQRRIRERRRS